ncbi:MAG: VIT domain-containing protein [Bacteroidia bacterium]|nr:VIT domain-containing protein [Bacteroidia bacterium]
MKRILLLLLLLLPCAQRVEAGKLFARAAGTASPIYNLCQTIVNTTVTIRDLLAVTHVDETFLNTQSREVEAWYVFQLPEGAVVDGLWLWIDGKRETFVVKRREVAQQIYDSLAKTPYADPAMLQTLGANRFQLRLANIGPAESRRIELQYFLQLPVQEGGVIRYVYPVNMSGYQTSPVEKLQLTLDIEMGSSIADLTISPDSRLPRIAYTELSDAHVTASFGGEDILENSDFWIEITVSDWTDTLYVLRHTETASDTGFFMLWYPDTLPVAASGTMDVVFAVDASGSMTGLRADVVRASLTTLLAALRPYDRFRIVLFNDRLTAFPADTAMAFATAENVTYAQDFLSAEYNPRGITRFDEVLRSLAGTAFRASGDLRCIFISDGLPIDGPRKASELLGMLQTAHGQVRFFPLTAWSQPSAVLETIAQLSDGVYAPLEQGDNLEDVLQRITFTFGSQGLRDYLLTLPAFARETYVDYRKIGRDMLHVSATGLFTDAGEGECGISLRSSGNSTPYSPPRTLRLFPDTTDPLQVARFWASKRISDLLLRLADVTDSTVMREEIIRLSEKYMILSPFTAFLVYRQKESSTEALAELRTPVGYTLHQNFPNPFNPSTVIRFTMHDAAASVAVVRLTIYDQQGRLVRKLYEGRPGPGTTTLEWDGSDDMGRPLPSGLYYCLMSSAHGTSRISMTLLR